MFQKRLNGLAMMCIHKDLKLTADEVLDELIKKKKKSGFCLVTKMLCCFFVSVYIIN